MEIRRAKFSDQFRIEEIYQAARKFMKENGNASQWGDTYPEPHLIHEDIKQRICYVCEEDNSLLGVFVFIQGEDPTYQVIENGRWVDLGPYGTIHRIAATSGKKGIGAFCIEWCFAMCGNIRIDTHKNNIPMQNLLDRLNFKKCGIIYTADNTPRIAYQKVR